MTKLDLSSRLDAVSAKAEKLKLPLEARLALEAAAEIVAEKLSKSEQAKIEKGDKKNAKKGKVWVDVSSQPEKHKKSYMGRASFYWKNDPDKHKHSVNITLSGPAKLSIKGKDLHVVPKDGEPFDWGEEREAQEGAPEADKDQFTKLDPNADENKDGITDAARVGIPAASTSPPPKLHRLNGLTEAQQKVEEDWNSQIESDTDAMTDAYLKSVMDDAAASGGPPEFVTDNVKLLQPDYRGKQQEFTDKDGKKKMVATPETQAWRASNNVLLHQGANAVAKKAFLKTLDDLAKLKDGDPRKSVLVTSGGVGCHAADTPILMADGTVKMVQDVREGDALMGPDSEPRNVLRLIHGHGPMYRVTPTKGESFVVNDEHVLSLKSLRGPDTLKRTQEIVLNMTVKELLSRGASFRRDTKLYRTGVDFPSQPVPLDPYFVGLWLGDGTSCSANVTSADEEVVEYLTEMARRFELDGIKLTVIEKPNNQACVYALARAVEPGMPRTNRVMHLLDEIGVLNNKNVPDLYARNDREARLKLLAGLLDSDGSLQNGGFDFISKHEHMSKAVVFVARSLGLAAYMTPAVKNSQTGFTATYYRVSISGETSMIPTIVKRKQAGPRQQVKDVLKTGHEIEEAGIGAFYGFTLDRDQLYLMGDFTVTHNSGKGFALKKGPDQAKALKANAGAVWDAAGEQNATENTWVLEEAKKRGIKSTFMFLDAPPARQWAHPKMGVVQRAADPEGEGRMVDARLFADSYSLGPKNFKVFQEKHDKKLGGSGEADFLVINTWNEQPDKKGEMMPVMAVTDKVDDRSANADAEKLYAFATKAIEKAPTEAIKEGATIGQKIWGPPEAEAKATARALTVSAVVSKAHWRMVMAADVKDANKSPLHKLLVKNFQENLDNLDKFLADENTAFNEKVKTFEKHGLTYDKDGKLVLPKK